MTRRLKPENILVFALFVFYFLFFIQKIDFVRADLGRMLKNGEIFFNSGRILDVNFYSYTEPDVKVLNMHWAADALFYKVRTLAGFKGLTLFYALLHTVTFGFFFLLAKRRSNLPLAVFASLLAVPLLASRTYIRPEVFSYLFLGIYLFALDACLTGDEKPRVLWTLPFLQIVWTNTHFFFALGPLLVLFFTFQANAIGRVRSIRTLIILFFATSAACLVNPFFIEGAKAPLLLFKEYGYLPLECLPVLQLMKHAPHPVYVHFFETFVLFMLVMLWMERRKALKPHFIYFFSAFVFGILTFRVTRAYPLFGYFLIPSLAVAAKVYMETSTKVNVDRFVRRTILAAVVTFGVLLSNPLLTPVNANTGLGMSKGMSVSAEFFKNAGLKGPIFNNFGIGGYLEYYLYPQERVFVDNRPEAFSISFLKNEYSSALNSEAIWKDLVERHDFQVIFFHLRLPTFPTSAKPFIQRRLADPEWTTVYVDPYAVILVRKHGVNAAAAESYGTPPENIYVSK